MSGWARGISRRRTNAHSRNERHHAAGVVRHVIGFAFDRVVAPRHRRGPVDRERIEVGQAKRIGQLYVVGRVLEHLLLEIVGLDARPHVGGHFQRGNALLSTIPDPRSYLVPGNRRFSFYICINA